MKNALFADDIDTDVSTVMPYSREILLDHQESSVDGKALLVCRPNRAAWSARWDPDAKCASCAKIDAILVLDATDPAGSVEPA